MFSVVFDNRIAVASIFDDLPRDWFIVDCRPLIDGPGNAEELIQNLLTIGIEQLSSGSKVCFACDYGHSRSNLLAALAIERLSNVSIAKAVEQVRASHPESSIKQGILQSFVRINNSRDGRGIRFALTGANGMIANKLSDLLEFSGYRIFKLTRAAHGNYLNSVEKIEELIDNTHATDVIHLAYPKPYNSYESSRQSFNHLSRIAEVCISRQCRLHFISSWVVFDGAVLSEVTEDSQILPHSLYSQSKALQESFLQFQHLSNNLHYRIYRLPGLFSRESLEPRFFRYIADCIATKQVIVTHSFLNGSAVVPLCQLEVAVEELRDAILCNLDCGPIIHIAKASSSQSVQSIAEYIAAKYGVGVSPTPVDRKVFTGMFSSRLDIRGSPIPKSPISLCQNDPLLFIEDLINEHSKSH
jgi:dTDP-4-dehydrorhamnose reductase